ncbi:unnamed protein product [Macrosiphum euphorbiae]|uniref:Uncharacterized protein n=1 Tax=Macrosiphum euphorbiae TaxID=13131 RepID=A0AAV0VUN6_9HEMI|nr:unnamed protein product [Macrosiphum euphorbiae]
MFCVAFIFGLAGCPSLRFRPTARLGPDPSGSRRANRKLHPGSAWSGSVHSVLVLPPTTGVANLRKFDPHRTADG